MPARPGHGAWLTEALINQAKGVLEANPEDGAVSLSRALDCTEYRAEVLLKHIRNDASPESSHHPTQLRQRISELECELSVLKTARGRMHIVAEAMAKEIHRLPKLTIEKYHRNINKKLDQEDIVLVISDVHVGSWVSPDATGGLGNYSYEIFVRRLERLIKAVFSILSYMPHHVPRIHVVFAGDIVDGGRIFKGHARQTDLIVAQQVTKAYEKFAHLIAVLAGIDGVEVVVSTVPGNHGRIGDKGELSPTDNFDWLVGWFLQERFDLLGVKNVRFNLPETWWMLLKVRETAFHISHGEAFKGWAGIPFYGALRYKQKLRELLRETFAKSGDGEPPDFDALLCGHHHELAWFGGIYMNGTFVGGSEYSLKDLQVGGPPYQLMLGVHDTIGVSWQRKLVLADPKNKPMVPVYS
jgi:hypothetical protein